MRFMTTIQQMQYKKQNEAQNIRLGKVLKHGSRMCGCGQKSRLCTQQEVLGSVSTKRIVTAAYIVQNRTAHRLVKRQVELIKHHGSGRRLNRSGQSHIGQQSGRSILRPSNQNSGLLTARD